MDENNEVNGCGNNKYNYLYSFKCLIDYNYDPNRVCNKVKNRILTTIDKIKFKPIIIEKVLETTKTIDNKTLGNPNSKMYQETIIKFGQSNNLNERVKTHKKTYENFRLYNAFKVKNKIEIENCIKKHSTLKNRLRIVTIDDRKCVCIDTIIKYLLICNG
jgi:hypothetical protein